MTIQDNNPSTSPKKHFDRVTIIILAVFLVLAVGAGVVAFRWSQWFFATTTFIDVGDAPPVAMSAPGQKDANDNLSAGDERPTEQPSAEQIQLDITPRVWDGTSRVTLLVMGLDYRDWSEGVDVPRTDTMILFSLDPLSKKAGMISIPRDMWVSIPGFGYGRINSAYRVGEIYKLPGGGPALAAKTVELFLGVPVDYVALIDFNSFVRFIDEMDGLDMHIREPITVDPIGPGNTVTLEPGVQTLDGATVLAYARMRYTEDGDFDRSNRQQEVIMAMFRQITQFNQLPMLVAKAPKLYEELGSGIRTNLSLDQAIQLAWLAVQLKEEDIRRGVFDPHKDVAYGSVITSEGRADILVPNPDRIRLLRDEIFASDDSIGPSAEITDPADRMRAEAARVMVRNGTQNPAVAQAGEETLRSLGVNVIAVDAAGQAYANTTFIDHTGNPYTIRYLIETLKLENSRVQIQFDPNSQVDLEVIFGNDWVPQ